MRTRQALVVLFFLRAEILLVILPVMLLAFIVGSGAAYSAGQDARRLAVDSLSGSVTPTENPLVAQYSVVAKPGASVMVEFGLNTSYPFRTSAVSAPAHGGQVNLLVAGMKASTTYHMRADVIDEDGSRRVDVDHLFTTGAPDPQLVPNVQISETGIAPSPGIEMLELVNIGLGPSDQFEVAAEDLQGNLIWYYNDPNLQAPYIPNPVKLLSDGSVLINFSETYASGFDSVLRDVDLAGNTKWQITWQGLGQLLAAKGCFTGANTIGSSHDFVELPNGHLILIVDLVESFSNLPGYPGTTAVSGDGLADLDQDHNVAWCWSAFDHLDINRHPWNFPDWTHTNAVLYSARDGNLIISMRHQNWLLKLNYQNGAGDGGILWHLGYQGDFALKNGTDPIDWFYAQHGPSIINDNGQGLLTLGVFDNGNDRVVDTNGDMCGTDSQVACLSRATVFELDERTKTAKLAFHSDLPYLSDFGGNVDQLANSDLEFDAAASSPTGATIEELTYGADPQLVWQLQVLGQFAYRGVRIPSLYPGVQW